MTLDPQAQRIVPEPVEVPARDVESLDVWGFADTRFVARPDGVVVLEGGRYELSGQELADLLPWVQGVIHPGVRPDNLNPPHYPPPIPEPRRNEAFLDDIAKSFAADQITEDP